MKYVASYPIVSEIPTEKNLGHVPRPWVTSVLVHNIFGQILIL
jgi:hypothetical protein